MKSFQINNSNEILHSEATCGELCDTNFQVRTAKSYYVFSHTKPRALMSAPLSQSEATTSKWPLEADTIRGSVSPAICM